MCGPAYSGKTTMVRNWIAAGAEKIGKVAFISAIQEPWSWSTPEEMAAAFPDRTKLNVVIVDDVHSRYFDWNDIMRFIGACRHLNIAIVMVCQSLIDLPYTVRHETRSVYLFRTLQANDCDLLFKLYKTEYKSAQEVRDAVDALPRFAYLVGKSHFAYVVDKEREQ